MEGKLGFNKRVSEIVAAPGSTIPRSPLLIMSVSLVHLPFDIDCREFYSRESNLIQDRANYSKTLNRDLDKMYDN